MKKNILIKDMIAELKKFGKDDKLCIIASTDSDCPDEGANFIDGAGVKKVVPNDTFEGKDVVTIVVGDSGKMTVGQAIDSLRKAPPLRPATVRIGYMTVAKDLVDAADEDVGARTVVDCTVLDGDNIWNLILR
jgi:hypothetical protein